MSDLVVSGLTKKRAEIAGQIEDAQKRLRMLIVDLDNIDAALRIFNPNIDLAEIKRKRIRVQYQAYKGEVTRLVFATLRQAKAPLTAQEITRHVIVGRGLDPSHKQLVKVIERRVGACLSYNKARGLVSATKGTGSLLQWETVHPR